METAEYKVMFEVEENHFWYRGMRKITEILLQKYLPQITKNTILDAGCGTGGSILFLRKFGLTFGVDISPLALSYCKNRGLKNIRQCSIEKMPFGNNKFDIVTCFDVVCQQEVKNDIRALREFYRILKPNGLLILRVPAYNWLRSYHDRLVHTKHRYTRSEVSNLLKEANFSIRKISYINTFLFPLVVFKRILLRFFPQKHSDVASLSPFLNNLFFIPLAVESKLIIFADLPFGVSVVAVAQKKKLK